MPERVGRRAILACILFLVLSAPGAVRGEDVRVLIGDGDPRGTVVSKPGLIEITAETGQTIEVGLAANPTTGYSWRLAEPLDERIVGLAGHEFRRAKSALIGAGGEDIWRFKATYAGETRITLIYARSWEKDRQPARTTILMLRVLP